MADPKIAVKTPEGATVGIPIPPGMTAEEVVKAFASFQTSRATSLKAGARARYGYAKLADAHSEEFERYKKDYDGGSRLKK